MEKLSNNVNLIGGVLLGAAVGAVLGMLFAPDKGSETRKRISAKGDDLTDKMKEQIDSFIRSIKAKSEVEGLKEKELTV